MSRVRTPLPAPLFSDTCDPPPPEPLPEESEKESEITESSAKAISLTDSSETRAYRSVVRVDACPIGLYLFLQWDELPLVRAGPSTEEVGEAGRDVTKKAGAAYDMRRYYPAVTVDRPILDGLCGGHLDVGHDA
jgi:hypothetical protein